MVARATTPLWGQTSILPTPENANSAATPVVRHAVLITGRMMYGDMARLSEDGNDETVEAIRDSYFRLMRARGSLCATNVSFFSLHRRRTSAAGRILLR